MAYEMIGLQWQCGSYSLEARDAGNRVCMFVMTENNSTLINSVMHIQQANNIKTQRKKHSADEKKSDRSDMCAQVWTT